MAMKNKASKLGVKHKYHGLVNQGSTCYLNSVLQVLFMTEDFRESVTKTADSTYIDFELRDLFKDLEKRIAYTRKITNRLNIKNVSVPRDAAEHYEKILRLTSPEASQIFHGKLINRNKCKQCDTKYDSPAGFWSLPLPLVNNTEEYSVEKGIEDFFRPSEISGDDQMYCEKCDEKRDAVLDCVVEHHPEVLVLLLKRFEFDYEYTYTYVKNQRCVNVPDTLKTPGNPSYKLYAMVEHFGELQYGHYISTIKSQDDDTWYTFDDSSVTPRSTLPALQRSQSAYLLFYRKLKEIEEIPPKRARSDDEGQESVHVKKPKQELSGEELNFDGKVQKCEVLDTGSSSSNPNDSQFYPDHGERGERPNPPEPEHNSAGDITSGGTVVNAKHTEGFGTGERFTQTSESNSLGREAVGAYGSTNQFEEYKPKYAQGEGQGLLKSEDKHQKVKTEEPLSETCQDQVNCETQDFLRRKFECSAGADGSTNQPKVYMSRYAQREEQPEKYRLTCAQGEDQGSLQSDDQSKIVQIEEPSSVTWEQKVECETQDHLGTEVVGADGSTKQLEDFRLVYAQRVKTEEPLSETWQQQVECETQDTLGTEVVGADGSSKQLQDFRSEYAKGESQGYIRSDDKPKIVKTGEPLSETCQDQINCETQDFLRRKFECSAGADGSTNQPKVYMSTYAQREEKPEKYRPRCALGDGSLKTDDEHEIVKTDYALGEGQGSFETDDKSKIVKIEKPSSEMFQHQVKRESECSADADGSTNQPEKTRPERAQGEGQGSLQSDDKSKIVQLCEGSDNGCDYGSCEGSELHTTEKQKQNIDLADTTLPATHSETEETNERENENNNDTRFPSQYLGSGGNSLDQQTESPTEMVKLEVFNCAEEKNSNDASPMNASSPVCGYTEEESSGLLRENGCKNTDEKEGEFCTDESCQDSDQKGHPKESFISAEGEKDEKKTSNCTDSKREVNQNNTEPDTEPDLTRSVDTRERTERVHFQNVSDGKSKAGVKQRLTIYDLYLSGLKSNYYERSNVYDEEKLKEPGRQAEGGATRGLPYQCLRDGDEEGNIGNDLSVTQTCGKIQSRAVEIRGDEEIIRITLKESK